MTIIWYQLSGLLAALILQCGLLGLSLRVSSAFWPLAYLVIIVSLSSFFTLQAFFPMQIIVATTVTAIAFVGGWHFLRWCKNREHRFSWLIVIVLAIWLIDLLYAAFPDHRYDQWNYHLVIGKVLVRSGPLAQPVLSDHLYFSGLSDYLTVIPRLLWDDDIFAHCFSNAFSYLAFALPFLGLVRLFVDEIKLPTVSSRTLLTLLIACSFLFAIPDHEVLVSSKPDAMLITFGLAAFYLISSSRLATGWRTGLLLFFIVAPVAYKLTYMHFAFAMVLTVMVMLLRRELSLDILNIKGLLIGVASGILVTLPYFAKNLIFFANPVHPVQFTFFRSAYWGAEFERYWRVTSGKAASFSEYMVILLRIPANLAQIGGWFLAVTVFLFIVSRGTKSPEQSDGGVRLSPWALAAFFVGLVFLWPFFYSDKIFSRFLYPMLAFFMVITLKSIAKISRLNVLITVLLLPIIFNSSIDSKLRRMSYAFARSDDYFNNGRDPLRHYQIDREVNKHKAANFPSATYHEKRVLTDDGTGYFLDTDKLDIDSPDYQYHLENVVNTSASGGTPCIWDLLVAYDISYLRSLFKSFDDWPLELRPVVAAAETIGAVAGVKYLSRATSERMQANCPK